MNRFLSVACVVFGLACVFFAWDSVTVAREERDRAIASGLQMRSTQEPAIGRSARSEETIEQPHLFLERVAQATEVDDKRQLAVIQDRLAQLESAIRLLQVQPKNQPIGELLNSAESIDDAIFTVSDAPEERGRRIQLMERFLDLFPNHPRAIVMLEGLIAEHLESNPALALTSLDSYGLQVVADPSKLNAMRANALIYNQRFDDGRDLYEQVSKTAEDDIGRAGAHFGIACSYMRERKLDEAKRRFTELILLYGQSHSPALANTITNARQQLELIDKLQSKTR